MISLDRRISALEKLGAVMKAFYESHCPKDKDHFVTWHSVVENVHYFNPWLVERFVYQSFFNWSIRLSGDAIREWAGRYTELESFQESRHVAVIPEENIPLAGLHDFLCLMLTGQHFYARDTGGESGLLKLITDFLIETEPGFVPYIHWCDSFPKQTEVFLIAARTDQVKVFKKYFGSKPCLIREPVVSVGVLTESGQEEDTRKMGGDILDFFGFSINNIRKLYVPESFTVDRFYPALESYVFLYNINRYANNFDYHRSVLLLNQTPFFENGFLIMRECSELKPSIGCVYFEYYSKRDDLEQKLRRDLPMIQNVVSSAGFIQDRILPGESHRLPLHRYPGHRDTVKFLLTC